MTVRTIRSGLAMLAVTGLVLTVAGCTPYYDSGRSSAYRAYRGAPSPVSKIPVPPDGMHTVERGNTVYAISRLYGVPVRAIIEENNLHPPYLLRVGDRLRVPRPKTYRVARGDTVYSISRRYGVPMNELMRANGITPPYTIYVGQDLTIPDGGQRTRVAAGSNPRGAGEPRPPAAGPKTATPTQAAALPSPPPRGGRTFLWPVSGRLVSGFGRQSGGSHNDGINIAAPRGSKVVAAENGIVAYAGNELRGFGNLLLIKHADGYMTAYGHNEQLLVVRGQEVRKGQVIAHVGSSGNVSTPQLHFEIRKGRKAVDPMRYLPRQTVSR